MGPRNRNGLTEQEILNFGLDDETINPPTSIRGQLEWTGEGWIRKSANAIGNLIALIGALAACKQKTNESLRVTLLTGSTTAATGTLTGVTTLTNFGTGHSAYVVAVAQDNMSAVLGNINNVVIT